MYIGPIKNPRCKKWVKLSTGVLYCTNAVSDRFCSDLGNVSRPPTSPSPNSITLSGDTKSENFAIFGIFCRWNKRVDLWISITESVACLKSYFSKLLLACNLKRLLMVITGTQYLVIAMLSGGAPSSLQCRKTPATSCGTSATPSRPGRQQGNAILSYWMPCLRARTRVRAATSATSGWWSGAVMLVQDQRRPIVTSPNTHLPRGEGLR